MAQYTFSRDAGPTVRIRHKDADAQQIGDALAEINDQHGGRLKPEHVVDAARPKTHALHKFFEWRDKVAAEAYRRDQARSLIRSINIVRIDDPNETAPAYVSLNNNGISYRSVMEVLSSPLLREQLLHQARRDLIAFERRYQDFADLVEAVAGVRNSLVDRKIGSDENRAHP